MRSMRQAGETPIVAPNRRSSSRFKRGKIREIDLIEYLDKPRVGPEGVRPGQGLHSRSKRVQTDSPSRTWTSAGADGPGDSESRSRPPLPPRCPGHQPSKPRPGQSCPSHFRVGNRQNRVRVTYESRTSHVRVTNRQTRNGRDGAAPAGARSPDMTRI